jgi:hypothetical protein
MWFDLGVLDGCENVMEEGLCKCRVDQGLRHRHPSGVELLSGSHPLNHGISATRNRGVWQT